MEPKLLKETFPKNLKTQIFIICSEKMVEKLRVFYDEDFAAYINTSYDSLSDHMTRFCDRKDQVKIASQTRK